MITADGVRYTVMMERAGRRSTYIIYRGDFKDGERPLEDNVICRVPSLVRAFAWFGVYDA